MKFLNQFFYISIARCFHSKAVAGICDAEIPSWTYDSIKNECFQFSYGGCQGNDNRFGSKEECENICKN